MKPICANCSLGLDKRLEKKCYSRGVIMITQEEAIKATNLIFEFCCQQMDCKSCPFLVKRFFVPEQGYRSCGLYDEPCAWNRVWNGGE